MVLMGTSPIKGNGATVSLHLSVNFIERFSSWSYTRQAAMGTEKEQNTIFSFLPKLCPL